MAMGRRKRERQGELFLPTQDLAVPRGHVFYDRLNRLLAEAGFDDFVEALCEPYYDGTGPGRPSIPPGTYFRMLFIGYFEGLGSQRGIAWRCHDSLSLRAFLGVGLNEQTPDHSTLSLTRGRLPQDVHDKVFEFVLKLAGTKQLLQAKTVGVDSTYLEANAAMKSIVRKDTGEDYQEYLQRLAQAEGIENPTKEDLQRFDRKRKGKKCSNEDWQSATDADSRIAKMKDGTTHLAYKAEHVVDLENGLLLAAEIRPANEGDTETIVDSLVSAQGHLNAAATLSPEPTTEQQIEASVGAGAPIEEVAADKGYHSADTLELMSALTYRSYIPEPKRPHRLRWDDKTPAHQRAVYGNRRRVARAKSKRLQRWRSERVERGFAHVCETGAGRRTWLRGMDKVTKRYLIQAAAYNLGIVMRRLFGIGKPRCLQGPMSGWFARVVTALMAFVALLALWPICRPLLRRRLRVHTTRRPCADWTSCARKRA